MKKLLVCEDEDAIREFEVLTLRRAGYEVVERRLTKRRTTSAWCCWTL